MTRNVILQPKIKPQINQPLKIVDRTRTVSLDIAELLIY